MKKLHEIKIIYISKKKKKNPNARTSSRTGGDGGISWQSEDGVSHDRKGSPAHLKSLNGPNHEPVVPFEGTSLLSRETPPCPDQIHSLFSQQKQTWRASTRATLDYSTQQTSLPASKLPSMPSFRPLFSAILPRGWEEGIQPTMIVWIDDIWWWKTRSNHLNLTWNSNDNLFDRWIPQVSNQWE